MNFKERFGKNYNGVHKSPPDQRDYKFNQLIPVGAIKIPKNYSTEMPPFIYNQGTSSQCAACAYSTIRFLQQTDKKSGGSGIKQKFSPSFTYGNRIDGEEFEGMVLRSVCKKGRQGSIPWKIFPGFYNYSYCKKKFLKNKQLWLEMAKPFAISSFYQCNSREQIQKAIIESKGVLAGIYIFDCVCQVGPDGIVHPDENRDIENHGGHAIALIGWRTDDQGNLWYKAINSWGRSFGQEGVMWIPERFYWLESPWAIIDNKTSVKWKKYKQKYGL